MQGLVNNNNLQSSPQIIESIAGENISKGDILTIEDGKAYVNKLRYSLPLQYHTDQNTKIQDMQSIDNNHYLLITNNCNAYVIETNGLVSTVKSTLSALSSGYYNVNNVGDGTVVLLKVDKYTFTIASFVPSTSLYFTTISVDKTSYNITITKSPTAASFSTYINGFPRYYNISDGKVLTLYSTTNNKGLTARILSLTSTSIDFGSEYQVAAPSYINYTMSFNGKNPICRLSDTDFLVATYFSDGSSNNITDNFLLTIDTTTNTVTYKDHGGATFSSSLSYSATTDFIDKYNDSTIILFINSGTTRYVKTISYDSINKKVSLINSLTINGVNSVCRIGNVYTSSTDISSDATGMVYIDDNGIIHYKLVTSFNSRIGNLSCTRLLKIDDTRSLCIDEYNVATNGPYIITARIVTASDNGLYFGSSIKLSLSLASCYWINAMKLCDNKFIIGAGAFALTISIAGSSINSYSFNTGIAIENSVKGDHAKILSEGISNQFNGLTPGALYINTGGKLTLCNTSQSNASFTNLPYAIALDGSTIKILNPYLVNGVASGAYN